jgi:transglutaminase-like putative cysteine protease
MAGWSHSTPLLAGDAGTSQTIDLIRQAVWQGLQDARVRAQLAQILQSVLAYDKFAEVQAIYAWVLRNIRFTDDPVGHETVSTPNWILTHRIGDCDDINAVLIPTLVMTAGIPARLVTVSNDPSDPSRFSHIYAEAQIGAQWIPLDAARPGARFGTTVSQYGRKRLWSLVDRKYQDLAGLSGAYVGRAGMGAWDIGAFTDIVSGITKSVTDVIASIRRPQIALPPPPGSAPAPTGTTTQTAPGGISTGMLLVLGALGLGAVMLMKDK